MQKSFSFQRGKGRQSDRKKKSQPDDCSKATLRTVRPAKILVPVDFSKESMKALHYALMLSGEFHSSIVILHVVEPFRYVSDLGYGPVTCERSCEPLVKSASRHLRRLARNHLGGTSWDAVVRNGTPFSEIVNAAKELKVDLVIMSTRGLSDLKDVHLGSTAERVVRYAPCPVLTLRNQVLAAGMATPRRIRTAKAQHASKTYKPPRR